MGTWPLSLGGGGRSPGRRRWTRPPEKLPRRSHGRRGGPLTVWTKDSGSATLQPQKVTPVDTTAAGDSFAAGLLASLATGHDLEAAATRAMALAAEVIQAPGALVPEIFENGRFA